MNVDFRTWMERVARAAGQRVQPEQLGSLHPPSDSADAFDAFEATWALLGLSGQPQRLDDPAPADLPFVAWVREMGWLLVHERDAQGRWLALDATGAAQSVVDWKRSTLMRLPRRSHTPLPVRHSALRRVVGAMLARKRIFAEAMVATTLVNFLALGTSLFAMQVFDRVIPNQGYQTLWVLTVGVTLAVLLEFVLKQVRSHMIDRTCNAIDSTLSSWFFGRMLTMRMEVRPPMVGTLAAQLKGFELVRGVLASASLFVLADLPFALLFVVVMAMVGGPVALIPLAVFPLALVGGLLFQRLVRVHTRRSQALANRKSGLLVEAVDGAESVKATQAEWRLQGRWDDLVQETIAAEQGIRNLSSWTQNLTSVLQQLSYVAVIAFGAWLVARNELTMGGLLACSIISNRALLPLVQLPNVMVNWAHARAAIDGLDQVVQLPNEADDAAHAMAPTHLEATVRLEKVRFAYGQARRHVLELDRLEIRPGERVGVIGPVGAGKSSLLKVASGFYRPGEGKVFLSDMEVDTLVPAALRQVVGFLPQEPRLFTGTLRDNLVLGLADPGDQAILDAAQQTGLAPLIAGQPRGLGLEITEGGRGVSGGQRQLILLTRLLLARPRVWMLDEPTGAMDADNEARIVALLRATLDDRASAVIATHKTAMLPLFTRLVVVQNGRIALDGPRDEVLSRLASNR